jgi:hypothetical protein
MHQAEVDQRTNDIATYRAFARRIEEMKRRDVTFLEAARKKGRRVYGMGAPVKGNTLLNYFKIGRGHLSYLVEKNKLRKGLYSPGMHIPIVMEEDLQEPPDIYYVLAWNFRMEILANNTDLINKGVQFYFPVEVKKGPGVFHDERLPTPFSHPGAA